MLIEYLTPMESFLFVPSQNLIFNPNQAGGANGPQQIETIIYLQPIFRLTSNQAVNRSLSVTFRSIYKNLSI